MKYQSTCGKYQSMCGKYQSICGKYQSIKLKKALIIVLSNETMIMCSDGFTSQIWLIQLNRKWCILNQDARNIKNWIVTDLCNCSSILLEKIFQNINWPMEPNIRKWWFCQYMYYNLHLCFIAWVMSKSGPEFPKPLR